MSLTTDLPQPILERIISKLSNYRDIASLHRTSHLLRNIINNMLADPDSLPCKARQQAHFDYWRNKLINNPMKVFNMQTIDGIDAPEPAPRSWNHTMTGLNLMLLPVPHTDIMAYKYSLMDGVIVALVVKHSRRAPSLTCFTYWVVSINTNENEQCIMMSNYKHSMTISHGENHAFDSINTVFVPCNLRTTCDQLVHKSLSLENSFGFDPEVEVAKYNATRFENVFARLKIEHGEVQERINSLTHILDDKNVFINRCLEWRKDVVSRVRRVRNHCITNQLPINLKKVCKTLQRHFNNRTNGSANHNNVHITIRKPMGISNRGIGDIIAISYKDHDNFGFPKKCLISQPGQEEKYCTCSFYLDVIVDVNKWSETSSGISFEFAMNVQEQDAQGDYEGDSNVYLMMSVKRTPGGGMRCFFEDDSSREFDLSDVDGYGRGIFRNILFDIFPEITSIKYEM